VGGWDGEWGEAEFIHICYILHNLEPGFMIYIGAVSVCFKAHELAQCILMMTGLDGAAFSSRMPADKLTKQEIEFFSDIAQGSNSTILEFIFVRNKIVSCCNVVEIYLLFYLQLEAWLANPHEELTLEKVQQLIQLPNACRDFKSLCLLIFHMYFFI